MTVTNNDCDRPGLKPLETALAELEQARPQNVLPLATEQVAISSGLDRVLAEDVASPSQIPNYDNSAMDGYAYCDASWDGNSPLKVVGTALAGNAYSQQVPSGNCVRIMTGAQLPQGCDTVVIQENVALNDSKQLRINHRPQLGANIRSAGSDVERGQQVFTQGLRLSGVHIGMLATLGVSHVAVYRKLKVAVFSTGDELRLPGTELPQGCVYDSNRLMITTLLQRLNLEVIDLGIIADNPAAIEQAFKQAAVQADAVISSGGVSVGDADFTRDILQRLGDIAFYKLAIKPGKPFAFGYLHNQTSTPDANNRKNATAFFGLPGNPVSSAVTFHQLALPKLRQMSGEAFPQPLRLQVPSASAFKKRPGRTDFQRGLLTNHNGTLEVHSTGNQGSAIFSSMVAGNCYVVLEQDRGNVSAGEIVTVEPFDRWIS
ncbi:gephyrin-like molybdotransferase Glp [Teredinibacter waterburyi]|uniref:molybdopterin molybdotransferase MoeA n=1 Tax=Teredinibacter waterburyi TaxID=1500538 RepID=UPI00165F76A6|nr:gephyrin-like molybdotransferase Glp [Teredinibacter waterburyi]